MPKIFLNFLILIILLQCKQLTCMSQLFTMRRLSSSSEKAAVQKSVAIIRQALNAAGYTNAKFEIIVIHRQDQRNKCAQKFCLYPKHMLDPHATSVLKGDPQAVCLCTRQTKYDTPEHVIQARLLNE